MSLFDQARQRLKPSGTMYVLLSSDSDLHFLGKLIAKAGFRARIATGFSIMIESMIIYELTPLEPSAATTSRIDERIDDFAARHGARDERVRVRA
jgi:hypothetical protein